MRASQLGTCGWCECRTQRNLAGVTEYVLSRRTHILFNEFARWTVPKSGVKVKTAGRSKDTCVYCTQYTMTQLCWHIHLLPVEKEVKKNNNRRTLSSGPWSEPIKSDGLVLEWPFLSNLKGKRLFYVIYFYNDTRSHLSPKTILYVDSVI